MKRIIYTIVAATAVLTGSVAAAAPALASNPPQSYTTQAADHPDTTALLPGYPQPGQDATLSSPGGPVWAWDNLTVNMTPVPLPAGQADGANYRVQVDAIGTFKGFADPTTGASLASTGPVTGTISYDVQASQPPSGANLPAQQPGGLSGAHLSDMVLQLFNGTGSIVGGGDAYTFSYQNGAYVQDTSGTHGDVTATPAPPACSQSVRVTHSRTSATLTIIHRYCNDSYRAWMRSSDGTVHHGAWRTGGQSVAHANGGNQAGGWQRERTGGGAITTHTSY
jgi:hypothetical protein